jgi:hypothetical protein
MMAPESPTRRFLIWRADVGRLPGAGQRLMSSGALTIATRRLYLCMERAGAAGGHAWCCASCGPWAVEYGGRTLLAVVAAAACLSAWVL